MTFWIIYILAAGIVTGMLALLVREDIRKEGSVTIDIKDGLFGAAFVLIPIFNVLMALILIWYYISEFGSKHTITFGKAQGPK